MPTKRERRKNTKELKEQIVQLYLGGKPKSEIIREYDLAMSSLNRWIKQHPIKGANILKAIEEYADIADVILCHHERWEGIFIWVKR